MKSIKTIQELANIISSYKGKETLITFHSIGDSDAVASAMALAGYLGNTTIATPNYITNNARRMLMMVGYEEKIPSLFPKDVDAIIIVDANNTESLGGFKKSVEQFKGDILIIDHHILPTKPIQKADMFNNEKYSSTSEIVYELLKYLNYKIPDKKAAMLLYGTISDSADFQNSSTETFRNVYEMLKISGFGYQQIIGNMQDRASANRRSKTISDLQLAKTERVGDYVLMYGNTGSHANVIAEIALRTGADVAVFWSISKAEVSISARMRSTLDKELGIHLGALMQQVAPAIDGNGGGHPCAAGAYGPEKEGLPTATRKLLEMLRKKLLGQK